MGDLVCVELLLREQTRVESGGDRLLLQTSADEDDLLPTVAEGRDEVSLDERALLRAERVRVAVFMLMVMIMLILSVVVIMLV